MPEVYYIDYHVVGYGDETIGHFGNLWEAQTFFKKTKSAKKILKVTHYYSTMEIVETR